MTNFISDGTKTERVGPPTTYNYDQQPAHLITEEEDGLTNEQIAVNLAYEKAQLEKNKHTKRVSLVTAENIVGIRNHLNNLGIN